MADFAVMLLSLCHGGDMGQSIEGRSFRHLHDVFGDAIGQVLRELDSKNDSASSDDCVS